MQTQKTTLLVVSLLISWLSMSAQYELTVTNENCDLPGNQGRLVVSALGNTGPYEVTWSTGQQHLLTSDNPSATINNLPADDYHVTIKNEYGCIKILTATIVNEGLNCTPGKIGNFTKTISIYPNPNTGEFYIDFEKGINTKQHQLTIQDVNGKTIKLIDLPDEIDSPLNVNLADLANGVYMVSLQNGDHQFSERIVISK